jgi:hypothetical protein
MSAASREPNLSALLEFIGRYGVPVFPCRPDKAPLTAHGFKDATRDPEQVRGWSMQNPGCMWGMPTGEESGFLVLDVDRKNGVDGNEALAALVAKHGPLPETAEALTPSGGRHLYFAQPTGIKTKSSAGSLGAGLDVRGDGGYVVIPPSVTNGRAYAWEASSDPAEVAFAAAPAWLIALCRADQVKCRPYALNTPANDNGNDVTTPVPQGRRNVALVRLAGSMRRAGMERDEIAAALVAINAARCRPPLAEQEVHEIARKISRYQAGGQDDLLRSDSGAIRACEHNAVCLLAQAEQYVGLHWDTFLSRLRIDDRDWSDAEDIGALCWLQSKFNVPRFVLGQIRNAVHTIAWERNRDKLREFFENLPPWDGVQRIELALVEAWGTAESAFSRAASHNFFVALAARALRPGCKVDEIYVFESPEQGKLKSQALRALGGAFHAEIHSTLDTDNCRRELQGCWLAELAELRPLLNTNTAEQAKAFISATEDRWVEKYQSRARTYPRRFVFCATTNLATYWDDPSGARRLVPIRCGAVRLDLIEANRLQWFAEAKAALEASETWHEFPQAEADAERDERQHHDEWIEPAGEWLVGKTETTITAVLRDAIRMPIERQDKRAQMRAAAILRRLGWARSRNSERDQQDWRHRARIWRKVVT